MDEKISYRQSRDLGAVFSVSFGFIRQNFKTFYGSLLLYAGPFILAGSFFSSYLLGSGLIASMIAGRAFLYGPLILSSLVIMVSLFIGFTVYNTVLNKNVIVNETLPLGEKLTIAHIQSGFFADFLHLLLNVIVFMLFLALVITLFVFVAMGFGAMLDMMNGPFVAFLLVLLLLAFFFILGPVIAFVPVASLFVCQRDRINIFTAMSRVLNYMSGNFWRTWALSILALITYSFMAMIAQAPSMILNIISVVSRSGKFTGSDALGIVTIVVAAISSLLVYGVAAFYYLMCVFHYTGLEEKREGTAVMERINEVV